MTKARRKGKDVGNADINAGCAIDDLVLETRLV